MAYATAEDVATRLGRDLDDSEALIVSVRLDDAELMLRSRIKDFDDRIQDDATFEGVVKMVEAEMVLRLVRNPEGYIQESDGNYSYMIDASVANGRLRVLDEEWRLLGVRQAIATARANVSKPTSWMSKWGPRIDQWWFPMPPVYDDDDTAVWDS